MWFLARRFVLGCLMSYNTIIISVFLRRIDGGKHNVRLKYEYWFSIIGTTIEETTNITSNISRCCDWNCSSRKCIQLISGSCLLGSDRFLNLELEKFLMIFSHQYIIYVHLYLLLYLCEIASSFGHSWSVSNLGLKIERV